METITIVIASIVSGIVGAVGKTLIDGRKQSSDASLSANEQAISVYKNILERLEKQLNQLGIDQSKLELEFLTTRENNVELRIKNQFLNEKNALLLKQVEELTEALKKKNA
jgi:hypothetical protein